MITRFLPPDLMRFALVALVGLGVDIALSWTLAAIIGLPLPLAAVCGFLCAAVLNYFLHEHWTFGTGAPSIRRGSLYLAVLGATLGVRIGSVTLLQAFVLPNEDQELAVLLIAVGASFAANYLLSRRLVFRAGSAPVGTADK
jgi:putative flippase GtrA